MEKEGEEELYPVLRFRWTKLTFSDCFLGTEEKKKTRLTLCLIAHMFRIQAAFDDDNDDDDDDDDEWKFIYIAHKKNFHTKPRVFTASYTHSAYT